LLLSRYLNLLPVARIGEPPSIQIIHDLKQRVGRTFRRTREADAKRRDGLGRKTMLSRCHLGIAWVSLGWPRASKGHQQDTVSRPQLSLRFSPRCWKVDLRDRLPASTSFLRRPNQAPLACTPD
jgi:hypothetical protein